LIQSFTAEWLKLRKRPAVWVLGSILVSLVLVLTYVILFVLLLTLPSNARLGPGGTESLKRALYPANFVEAVLSGAGGSFGGAIALILGSLAYGSEFGWGTLKTVFTQRASRLETFYAKVAAVAAVLLIYDLVSFLTGALASSLIGGYFGHLSPWPSAIEIIKGVLAGWLILGFWASLGVVLAVLFRQSGLAIGLGLVYALAIETILFSLLGQFSWMRNVERAFPGANATALVESFASGPRPQGLPEPLVGAVQGTLVVAAYTVVFLAISALVLSRRDVT
jgi:ABC-2 type transport system permease protein